MSKTIIDISTIKTLFQTDITQVGRVGFDFHPETIPAAVLIPIVKSNNGFNLLFTIRTEHLEDHAGQVCFPGGRLETGETAYQAALRETEEEIGVAANHIDLIGHLPLKRTITGFHVLPLIGYIDELPELILEESEVAEAFQVPLDYILNEENYSIGSIHHQNKNIRFHEIQYEGYTIWGFTAAIVKEFQSYFNR